MRAGAAVRAGVVTRVGLDTDKIVTGDCVEERRVETRAVRLGAT
jgi:hypothetical protein